MAEPRHAADPLAGAEHQAIRDQAAQLLAELPPAASTGELVDDVNAEWADGWVRRAAAILREVAR